MRSTSRVTSASHSPRFSPWRVALLCGLLAFVLRLMAARGDLWLDEIWSLEAAQGVHTPADVYRIASDNNHPLNTMWLAVVGPDALPIVCRLPAVVMSSAGVVFGALLVRRRGLGAVAGAGGFGAANFLLVQYGSEARGYGPALGCALAAAWAGRECFDPQNVRRWRWAVVYAGAATLGTQAHAVFLPMLLALGIVTVYLARVSGNQSASKHPDRPLTPALLPGKEKRGGRSNLWMPLAMNAVPFVVAAAMAIGFYGRVGIEGGLILPPGVAAAQTLSAFVGGPTAGPWLYAIGAVVLAGAAGVLFFDLLHRDRLGVLFALGVFTTPLAWFIARGAGHAPLLYPRYFVLAAALLTVCAGAFVGDVLARQGSGRRSPRGAVGASAAIVLIATVASDFCLIRDGRGDYSGAVAWMIDHTPHEPLTVASNNHFRSKKILGYLTRAAPPATLIYLDGPSDRPPRWVIKYAEPTDPPAEPAFEVGGMRFVLDQSFPAYGLSGWRWDLYRLTAR